jgi:DNA polymerase/3'-5' exonuclease PolX
LSFKKDIGLAEAEAISLDFLDRTKDLYRKYLLAGSIRRREPIVHDIDFAVIPKGRSFPSWKERVTRRVEEIGGTVDTFGEVIAGFRYRGAQVNLFLCAGDDSWGVTQMWATGPKGHTIGMTIKAREKRMVINSRGLWTRDDPPKQVRARTEEEVGRLLGWKYKPPEERGKGGKKGAETFHY